VAAARILLVEDESLIRLVMADVLLDEGFEVVEAANGDEAVRLLSGPEIFDVLLTDVQMPGVLDGVDVATRARSLHPKIHILVVSGYAEDLMGRLSVLEPPAHFMSKPYSVTKVLSKLKHLLGTQ
jgi:CheY-like chemotaxis protein